jgi:hypothetical protein
VSALWAVWWLGCGLVAWGCLRAARDYHDEPGTQARDHEPALPDPDRQPGARDDLLATCRRIWDLTDHQPNHRTAQGDQ